MKPEIPREYEAALAGCLRRGGDLIKIIWHDGLGMSLYAKRLEKGRFIWPSPADDKLKAVQTSKK